MKCHCKIYSCLLLFILTGFSPRIAYAQNFLNQHYLADDIEHLINSNPDQALKIAQHLLSKTNTTNREKAKINFLISKAYRAKGDYSSALNFLFEEKNYDEYLLEQDKIAIDIEKTEILRELSLDKQAQKILEKLEITPVVDVKLHGYVATEIALERAKFFLQNGQYQKGLAVLQKNKSAFPDIEKTFFELGLYTNIISGQLNLELKDLTSSERYFDSALVQTKKENDANLFAKADILYGLASIAFLKKEHLAVISLSEEAMVCAQKLGNIFLQEKIMRQENVSYLALHDIANYKAINAKFVNIQSEVEAQEQEAINTAYNVISDEYTDMYLAGKSRYLTILYYLLGLFLVVVLVCLFYWQKVLQRKKRLDEIINYIEITRSNLVGRFTEHKTESKKHVILKETEEQLLQKLKRFENSKRFINKDISLAVLAGQLDSNTKYLSEVINTHYHVNFNTYINKLRINYIIEKLKTDPNFINYKISYLAENCGFASHSSFATVFKSITGISPVKFIELLNEEKKNNLLE